MKKYSTNIKNEYNKSRIDAGNGCLRNFGLKNNRVFQTGGYFFCVKMYIIVAKATKKFKLCFF